MASNFRLEELIRRYPPREKKQKKAPKGSAAPMYQQQLCWRCENACGGCEWSARFEPVPGWDAIATTRTVSGKFVEKSFSVRACPKFRRG